MSCRFNYLLNNRANQLEQLPNGKFNVKMQMNCYFLSLRRQAT